MSDGNDEIEKKIGKAGVDDLGVPKKKPTYTSPYGSGYGGYSGYGRGYGGGSGYPNPYGRRTSIFDDFEDDEWERYAPPQKKGGHPTTSSRPDTRMYTTTERTPARGTLSHIVTLDAPVQYSVGVKLHHGIVFEPEDIADMERRIMRAISQACDDLHLVFNMEARDDMKVFVRDLVRDMAYYEGGVTPGFCKVLENGKDWPFESEETAKGE